MLIAAAVSVLAGVPTRAADGADVPRGRSATATGRAALGISGKSQIVATDSSRGAIGQASETTWVWASKGPLGLWVPWDDVYPVADVAPGATAIPLNTVEGLRVGDTFGAQGNQALHRIASIDRAAKAITIATPMNPAGIRKQAYLSRGGNWLDRDGVFRGTAHHVSERVATISSTHDISAIDGDLFIPAPIRIASVEIDGQPAEAFAVTHGSNSGALPTPSSGHTFVKNPDRGRSLTITRIEGVPQTLLIDKVAAPVPREYAFTEFEQGPLPDIFSLELTSEAAVRAAFDGVGSSVGRPYAYEPEFGTEPNRLRYLRFANLPSNQRALAWVKRLPRGYDEIYFQYAFHIEEDVWSGHFEGGTKLPGVRYAPTASSPGVFGDRGEHTGRSLANPGLWGLVDYSFTAQTLPGYPPSPESNYVHVPRNIVLKAGRWYVIEHRSKMNTPGMKDGIRTIWINGHRVFHTEDYNFRGEDASAKWNELNVNVYHGGMGLPASPMHYRIAKIRASTHYIGVPREFSR